MEKTQVCECGNYVVGKPNYSAGQQIIRQTSKSATNWVLKTIITSVCTIIGLIFGVGIGAIPGFFIGLIISSFLGNSKENTANELCNNLTESTQYTFTCPKCGKEWTLTIKNSADTDGDELLQNLKDKKVASYKDKASDGMISIIISALVFAGSLWYWNTHSFQDSLWVGILLLGFGSAIIIAPIWFFISLSKYSSNKSKADSLNKMSIEEFRTSQDRFE